jgi:hypothetical protein
LNLLGKSLSNLLKFFCNFRDDPVRLIAIIVFLMPVFFLTIKSWVTTSLFILAIYCAWQILRDPKKYFITRDRLFWTSFLCLTLPFFCEVIAQLGRQALDGPGLDGASRTLLSGIVFVYLSTKNVEYRKALVSALTHGAAAGIVIVLLSLTFFPDQYWEHRAGTYFVDPITLPCYTVALFGIFLFGFESKVSIQTTLVLKAALFLMTAYIAMESYSRSSWIALMALTHIYVLYMFRRSISKQILATLATGTLFLIFYFNSEIIQSRVDLAVGGLFSFIVDGGGQRTSTGQRFILALIDLELLSRFPFFGVPDSYIPSFHDLKTQIPSLNEEIYEIKILAGSHTELLAQLVRKGYIFGGLTLWALFIYPLYLVSMNLRHGNASSRELVGGLIGLVVSILVSALTIQVFNLKMTISFYSVCLSIYMAFMYQKSAIKKDDL